MERSVKLNVPYQAWADQGFLIPTTGNVIDHRKVFDKFEEDYQKFRIQEVQFDRYGADWIVSQMQSRFYKLKEKVFPFGQGFISMNEPTKAVYRFAKQGRLEHGGHPNLAWHIANAVCKTDAADNWKLDKEASKDKIDAAVALVMAMKNAQTMKIGSSFSVYGSGLHKELNKIGIKQNGANN